MSFRVLIFIIIIGIILFWLRKQMRDFFRELHGEDTHTQTTAHSRQIETMVRCHYCHTHILPSEAIYLDGQPYCSQEHGRLYQKDI